MSIKYPENPSLGSKVQAFPKTQYSKIVEIIDNINNGIILNVSKNLSATSTTFAGTLTVLSYGVNVFTTVTSTNYAAKLPQPTTGKSVFVTNNGAVALSLFPSNIGGQINNLPLNQPAIIPADGKLYQFICIENPLPGAWTWSAPATGQLVFAELSVAHVNGVADNKSGITQAGLGNSFGLTLDGSSNLVPVGEWGSQLAPTTLVNVKCYSNILQTDLLSGTTPNAIQATMNIGYKDGAASSTYGPYYNFILNNAQSQTAPTGTLSSPALVGDTGTHYDIKVAGVLGFDTTQIGTGGIYSNYNYIFHMYVPASAATKTYKFIWILEYL